MYFAPQSKTWLLTGLRYIAKTPEIPLVAASFQIGDERLEPSQNHWEKHPRPKQAR
jgi:hypothetical protein